jgi:hypothetical protein
LPEYRIIGLEGNTTMKAERMAELRLLADSETSVTLRANELTWLLDTHYELKAALRGIFETHDAIDPPQKGPCPECLAATVVLDRVG